MEGKTLKNANNADISEVFNDMQESGLVFQGSFGEMSKHFLKEFLPVNPFDVDFTVLKDAYIEEVASHNTNGHGDEHGNELEREIHRIFKVAGEQSERFLERITANEDLFHKHVCNVFFDLDAEPRIILLKLYDEAAEDLNKIDITLLDIEKELKEIHDRNLSEEIQGKKPILYYYRERNEKAREEILSFIKKNVKAYALSQSSRKLFSSKWSPSVPYNYRYNPSAYEPRYPNDLENKFKYLLTPSFYKIYTQYKEDKSAFTQSVTQYIAEHYVVDEIRGSTRHHHVLSARQEIINEALDVYCAGSKIMFANAVPTIIEGIFHDLCVLIGESEESLLREGFQYKLEKLQPVLRWELHYEYYAFRFRLFRNKVAHGRLVKEDVEELTDLLLLDLSHVCSLVYSDRFPLNHKRFVIDELSKNIASPGYKYLMEYVLMHKVKIPDFYALRKQIQDIEELVSTDNFWGFLEAELKEGGDHVRHGIYTVLKALSARKPIDPRCASLFRMSGVKEVDKELADTYLRYLTRDF